MRVFGEELVQNFGAVILTKTLGKGLVEGDVSSAIVVDLINHFDSKCQADSVHADALDLGGDKLDALVLQTLGDHNLAVTGPVDAGKGDGVVRGILGPAAIHVEGRVGPGRLARLDGDGLRSRRGRGNAN